MSNEYKYDEKVLERLQNTECDMLRVLDKICQKYNIEYFIAFGTAIGALRHGGFIPWDDDIDVCMMREDYKRLREVPNEEWEGLYLSDPEDGFSAHTLIYPQIYKLDTVYETEYHYRYDNFVKDKDAYHPIWLDIFLLDRVKDVEEVKKKAKKAFLFQKLFYYSKSRIKVYFDDPVKKTVSFLCKNVINRFLSLRKNSSEKILKKYIEFVSGSSGEYITSFDVECTDEMIKLCEKYNDVFPSERVKFGDFEVNIQKNYHAALTKLYGDYMQMPPEEKRYNHPPKILDFGEGNVIK